LEKRGFQRHSLRTGEKSEAPSSKIETIFLLRERKKRKKKNPVSRPKKQSVRQARERHGEDEELNGPKKKVRIRSALVRKKEEWGTFTRISTKGGEIPLAAKGLAQDQRKKGHPGHQGEGKSFHRKDGPIGIRGMERRSVGRRH